MISAQAPLLLTMSMGVSPSLSRVVRALDCSKSTPRPHWQEYVCVSELSLRANDEAVVHGHLSPCSFSPSPEQIITG